MAGIDTEASERRTTRSRSKDPKDRSQQLRRARSKSNNPKTKQRTKSKSPKRDASVGRTKRSGSVGRWRPAATSSSSTSKPQKVDDETASLSSSNNHLDEDQPGVYSMPLQGTISKTKKKGDMDKSGHKKSKDGLSKSSHGKKSSDMDKSGHKLKKTKGDMDKSGHKLKKASKWDMDKSGHKLKTTKSGKSADMDKSKSTKKTKEKDLTKRNDKKAKKEKKKTGKKNKRSDDDDGSCSSSEGNSSDDDSFAGDNDHKPARKKLTAMESPPPTPKKSATSCDEVTDSTRDIFAAFSMPSPKVTAKNKINQKKNRLAVTKPKVEEPPKKPPLDPSQKIKPMAAWELREMLKIKGPPRRNPNLRDSPVFREENGPETANIPSMFRAGASAGKTTMVMRHDGTKEMVRSDVLQRQQKQSKMNKAEIKDALAKYLEDANQL